MALMALSRIKIMQNAAAYWLVNQGFIIEITNYGKTFVIHC